MFSGRSQRTILLAGRQPPACAAASNPPGCWDTGARDADQNAQQEEPVEFQLERDLLLPRPAPLVFADL
jgi:hypothetical protein